MHQDAVVKWLRRGFGWVLADDGATSIEYALLGTLIAVAIVGSVTMLGLDVKSAYEYVANCVTNLSCQ